jgi:hypothetical protein
VRNPLAWAVWTVLAAFGCANSSGEERRAFNLPTERWHRAPQKEDDPARPIHPPPKESLPRRPGTGWWPKAVPL